MAGLRTAVILRVSWGLIGESNGKELGQLHGHLGDFESTSPRPFFQVCQSGKRASITLLGSSDHFAILKKQVYS